MRKTPLIIKATFTLLFIILLFYGMIQARAFLYPLALGVFFSYLLYPIADFLEKKGLHRILATFFTIILGLGVILGVSLLIYSQLKNFMNDLPAMKDQALKHIEGLENFLEQRLGMNSSENEGMVTSNVKGIFQSASGMMGSIFAATTGTVFTFAILPVYIFCILFYRNKFKKFLLLVVPDRIHNKVESIINDSSDVIKKYMAGIFTVVLILCFLNTIGLFIVGVKYALLLGVLSAFFNLIPYFGTLIGGSIPFLVALLTNESPQIAFGVVVLFIIIQFLENNILTPNITGGNVSINPFITILSIIIGGLVWGVPGMFMVVPFLGVVKIVCDHVEEWKPYSFLLGNSGTEKHSLSWERIKKMFFSGK